MRPHYFCDTLYGDDHCSPRPGLTSKGEKCAWPCEFYDSTFGEGYYFCYTDKSNSTWDYCGHWDVPAHKKQVVEFTRYDYVCGDYCKPDEDHSYEWCNYAYWDYNATTNTANLRKSWDYCAGHVPPGMSTGAIIGTVLGVIGGIVLLTLILYFLANR